MLGSRAVVLPTYSGGSKESEHEVQRSLVQLDLATCRSKARPFPKGETVRLGRVIFLEYNIHKPLFTYIVVLDYCIAIVISLNYFSIVYYINIIYMCKDMCV